MLFKARIDKDDLAKYPFLWDTIKYIGQSHFYVKDMDNYEERENVIRVQNRLTDALFNENVVNTACAKYESEAKVFWSAINLVKCVW